MNPITLTLIEITIGMKLLKVFILAMIFNWIAQNQQDKQQKNLQQEMQNLEKQIKDDYVAMMDAVYQSKTELISQIKESNKDGGK
jgi:ABC-type transport system involved in cytochrome bd biosynthesis fused ATPase/permease subunit